jgi:hypothetical protein
MSLESSSQLCLCFAVFPLLLKPVIDEIVSQTFERSVALLVTQGQSDAQLETAL